MAAKGDDSKIELAETLSDLRNLPKPPEGDRHTLDELVKLTKLSKRVVCYLLKVWRTFSDRAANAWSRLVGPSSR